MFFSGSIIEGLASKDEESAKEASNKADQYIEKHETKSKSSKKPHDNTGMKSFNTFCHCKKKERVVEE